MCVKGTLQDNTGCLALLEFDNGAVDYLIIQNFFSLALQDQRKFHLILSDFFDE
jgi:hypothetical protein